MDENKPQIDTGLAEGKAVHTYASDMADAIRNNEMSVIKVALAEQNKRAEEQIYLGAQGTKSQKVFWVIGGIVFVILGIAGAYFVINKKTEEALPTQKAAPVVPGIVTYNENAFIDTTTTTSALDIASLMNPEIAKAPAAGKIKALFLTDHSEGTATLLPIKTFVSRAGITAPSSLTLSLADPYMIGTYGDTSAAPKTHLFMIFTVDDYNHAYAGLLQWEKSMLSDLWPFFSINVSDANQVLLEQPFTDILIDNKDARVLKDQSGNPLLYYMFVSKSNFIITDSPDVIREVISRLSTQNTKPL